jgi:hypothetical protein
MHPMHALDSRYGWITRVFGRIKLIGVKELVRHTLWVFQALLSAAGASLIKFRHGVHSKRANICISGPVISGHMLPLDGLFWLCTGPCMCLAVQKLASALVLSVSTVSEYCQ